MQDIAASQFERHELTERRQLPSRFPSFVPIGRIMQHAVKKQDDVVVDEQITFHQVFRDETDLHFQSNVRPNRS